MSSVLSHVKFKGELPSSNLRKQATRSINLALEIKTFPKLTNIAMSETEIYLREGGEFSILSSLSLFLLKANITCQFLWIEIETFSDFMYHTYYFTFLATYLCMTWHVSLDWVWKVL